MVKGTGAAPQVVRAVDGVDPVQDQGRRLGTKSFGQVDPHRPQMAITHHCTTGEDPEDCYAIPLRIAGIPTRNYPVGYCFRSSATVCV